jgi:uncharacterized membrane protein
VDKAAPPSPQRTGGPVLRGLMDLRPRSGLERTADTEDAVALGLAFAQFYAFASVDYPGAAQSEVWDSKGSTVVGGFDFDPSIPTGAFGDHDAEPSDGGSANSGDDQGASGTPSLPPPPSPPTAFTFTGGVYQILTVPSSTESIATGINASGLIVGVYRDLGSVQRGFVNDAGTFSNVEFPGASATQAFGVNDAGEIVGSYFDIPLEQPSPTSPPEHGFIVSGGTFTAIDFPGAAARLVTAATGINAAGDIVGSWRDGSGSFHGFLLQAGVFTRIDFPLAIDTRAVGISDTGEVAGSYRDAAGSTHGFIFTSGAFNTVDVVGARATLLTRIKNGGSVTGSYIDALNERHGLIGQ